MGEKKKNKDREKEKDKKKHKKKSKDRDRDRSKDRKDKKKKSKSRKYSSSSSYQSSSQSSSRSRSRTKKQKEKQKKKDKNKEKKKQENKPIDMPFDFTTKTSNPVLNQVTGIPGIKGAIGNTMLIPPPAPPSTTPTTVLKSKNKEINIFKLFPKLPPGPVTIARTIYSSKFLDKDFEINEFRNMCEELQKSARSEGSKRGASVISKCKGEIDKIKEGQEQMKLNIFEQQEESQFEKVKKAYLKAVHDE